MILADRLLSSPPKASRQIALREGEGGVMSTSDAVCHSVGLPDGEVFALAENDYLLCIRSQGLIRRALFLAVAGRIVSHAFPQLLLCIQKGQREVKTIQRT